MDNGPRPETKDECYKDGAPTTAVAAAPAPATPAAAAQPEPAEDTEPKKWATK